MAVVWISASCCDWANPVHPNPTASDYTCQKLDKRKLDLSGGCGLLPVIEGSHSILSTYYISGSHTTLSPKFYREELLLELADNLVPGPIYPVEQAVVASHVSIFRRLDGDPRDEISFGCHPVAKGKQGELALQGTVRLEQVSARKTRVHLDVRFQDPIGRGVVARKGAMSCEAPTTP